MTAAPRPEDWDRLPSTVANRVFLDDMDLSFLNNIRFKEGDSLLTKVIIRTRVRTASSLGHIQCYSHPGLLLVMLLRKERSISSRKTRLATGPGPRVRWATYGTLLPQQHSVQRGRQPSHQGNNTHPGPDREELVGHIQCYSHPGLLLVMLLRKERSISSRKTRLATGPGPRVRWATYGTLLPQQHSVQRGRQPSHLCRLHLNFEATRPVQLCDKNIGRRPTAPGGLQHGNNIALAVDQTVWAHRFWP